MKERKLVLILFCLLLIAPIINVATEPNNDYEYAIEAEEVSPIFYLFSLNATENFQIEISRNKLGNISLFLFDKRPINTYIHINQTLDNSIYENAVKYETSQNLSLNYSAKETRIHYIEIMIFNNGSDLLKIRSNKELSRYYLPQIPGFPVHIIIGIVIFSTIIITISRKKISII